MIALRCPVCSQPLQAEAGTWRCEAGHGFDTAREGYLNLLLVQQKKSLHPGDNQDMVLARRNFLAAGHYAPLREALRGLLTPLAPTRVLDVGAGEGYYTSVLADLAPEVVAIDIAKPAIRLAARKDPRVQWLVATAAALPLFDGEFDLACSLFSPVPAAELRRVLRPDAHLLVVTPAAGHLRQLRQALYAEVREHDPSRIGGVLAEGFRLAAQLELGFSLQLDTRQALQDLLWMTPYFWRARREAQEALLAREAHSDEAHFSLQLFQRLP